ncbi:SIS domain-containing protein [Streptantibioticus cattleyicolor]|uniref:Sugar isomerase (SIS) n=1 Tax=Streptantibioticus cattleyicolor (strain ATCC 35852 / DSM 46488 / JCM 4925 / NBRC 14057 / NRRL 8057) TaxID=1003195 RepID=F8JJ38_STREN|nr:SIS domain-containing protein [Streptantibioticus cattleyicolor]AEW98869.1 sugar isomerase (SIS) [Streptantibioticus cattleyicolor NRRL 8057 = DSM 46488]CCB72084.1 Predicted phosphosugar isomerase [Streptantibioticus cattleyicolor NRRL 8057 = DSM 46488]
MLKFDESEFVRQIASAVALRPRIEELVDRLVDQGFDNLFLVGAGGTYAQMWPYEHLARRTSTLPVRSAIAAELVAAGDAGLGERSVAVFTSVSGTTEDSVRAIEFCRAKGAYTVGFTGVADSPVARGVDTVLLTEPKTWPFDMQLLLFMGRLLARRGEFEGYEEFADEFAAIPRILVRVAERAEPVASAFAEAHKDTDYHFLIGAGNLWGLTYLYSMCILEEMQWLRTTRVHSAEFFHGSLELLERDTSVLVLQGEDESRPLTDRAIAFARRVSDDVTVFDTRDYPLEGISERFRPLLAPLVLDTVLDRVSKHLERVRDHSLDLRRYYRVMDY